MKCQQLVRGQNWGLVQDKEERMKSHDERRRADGNHEDEKELRADSPAMADFMLKCNKQGRVEGTN